MVLIELGLEESVPVHIKPMTKYILLGLALFWRVSTTQADVAGQEEQEQEQYKECDNLKSDN